MTTVATRSSADLLRMDPLQRAAYGFLARYRGTTLDGFSQDLRVFLNWCEERRLSPMEAVRPHLELYIRWMQEETSWAEATINRRYGTVALFYKYAVIDELLVRDPCLAVTRPQVNKSKQRRTWLRPMHMSYLLRVAQETGPMEHCLVALLSMCGLRISEATQLDIETHLGQSAGYTTISFVGKGGEAATIGLPPPVVRAVLRAVGERTEGPLMLNKRGNRMTRWNASRLIKAMAVVAGVDSDISPHSLRRTFCTTGLLNKIPLYEMQLAMRHATPELVGDYDMMSQSIDRNASYQIASALAVMAS